MLTYAANTLMAAFQTAYSMSRYLISISTYSSSAKRVGTL